VQNRDAAERVRRAGQHRPETFSSLNFLFNFSLSSMESFNLDWILDAFRQSLSDDNQVQSRNSSRKCLQSVRRKCDAGFEWSQFAQNVSLSGVIYSCSTVCSSSKKGDAGSITANSFRQWPNKFVCVAGTLSFGTHGKQVIKKGLNM